MIAAIPDSGVLSTNFVIPMSRYVSVLIAYPGTGPGLVEGELRFVREDGTNSLTVSTTSEEANYLRHLGLKSVLVNRFSLTDTRFVGGAYLPGSKCQILLTLTNKPKNSSVYLSYLK
jgi:hypothetical protein